MARLTGHFITSVYKLIFEHDPLCMSQESMEALLSIENWYPSRSGTFIGIFGGEKPLHVLPRFATDKLMMQEIIYHISIGLPVRLHKSNKAPWSTLPLWIGLYKIKCLNDAYVEAEEIKKYEFGNKDYNSYDPYEIFKNHCARVYYPWIHGACHWEEEDPWRYCYNHSNLNEPVSISIEWNTTLQATTP